MKSMIRSQKVDLVCLQETKVQEMFVQLVRSLGVEIFLDWEATKAK